MANVKDDEFEVLEFADEDEGPADEGAIVVERVVNGALHDFDWSTWGLDEVAEAEGEWRTYAAQQIVTALVKAGHLPQYE